MASDQFCRVPWDLGVGIRTWMSITFSFEESIYICNLGQSLVTEGTETDAMHVLDFASSILLLGGGKLPRGSIYCSESLKDRPENLT